MQHLITPYSRKIEPFVWWENEFTEGELNALREKARAATEPAYIGTNNYASINKDARRSNVSWMNNTPENNWVFKKLAHVGAALNAQYYDFDLTGFGEPLQLTTYDSEYQGMFRWHQDFGANVSRKLSMVMQLSDPADYEGGDLELFSPDNPIKIKKQRGLIAVFPSWAFHQVTPVTKGNRQSLVAWISGPNFK